ncbi:MAG TPA: leucine-rich repeat domain-containing protein, partial [Polyangiaceae bacterium]|nr:leucine-rich repeat domain-containing protein [Polyangiaceae bacterium]
STTGSGGRSSNTPHSGTGGSGATTSDPNQDAHQVGSCHFEDKILARAVRERLPEGDVANLHLVSTLSIGEEVSSLEGIACLPGLSDLYFYGDQLGPIFDLGPLSDVTSLRVVHLNGGQYENIQVLPKLRLTHLQLSGLDWASLDALEGASSIEVLWIEHTPARDLSALSSFTNLWSLTLSDTFGTDLSPLADLDRLRELTLYYMSVKELPGLGQVDDLQSLSLYNTDITSLEGLAGAPKLGRIDIVPAPRLQNLAGLEGLPALVNLKVEDSAITDLSALSGSTSLESIELPNADIKDVAPLSTCTSLHRVNLSHNQIVDVAPLAALPLDFLGLAQNQVVDLEPLSGASVGGLDVSQNPLNSLDPIGTFVGLVSLVMSNVGATSLDFLAGHELQWLVANNNQIQDVSVLSGMPLHELNLNSNQIETWPDGLVGAQGDACATTQLSGNPLDPASQDRLLALCSDDEAGSYIWDTEGCDKCPDLR